VVHVFVGFGARLSRFCWSCSYCCWSH